VESVERQTVSQKILDKPWRVASEVRRILALPYIRARFAIHGIAWGKDWQVFGMPIIQRFRGSAIILGNGINLRSWRSTNPLTPNHPVVLATRTKSAVIRVGDDCGLTGATLVAAERVEIGNRVLLGANVTIVDTDFHPLNPEERKTNPSNGKHLPVIIEDDVFIGMNSLVLKGVTIGRGSVVGAGSVVTRNIEPGVIVAGNPARVIRSLA
jgi:acetyltransferase-like isoleucine patch superfamily enzyme